jgi:hypothetical protein
VTTATAPAAATASGSAEARLLGGAVSREHGELAPRLRGAAVRALRIRVLEPQELLEVTLARHAHELVDRHRRRSVGRSPDAPQTVSAMSDRDALIWLVVMRQGKANSGSSLLGVESPSDLRSRLTFEKGASDGQIGKTQQGGGCARQAGRTGSRSVFEADGESVCRRKGQGRARSWSRAVCVGPFQEQGEVAARLSRSSAGRRDSAALGQTTWTRAQAAKCVLLVAASWRCVAAAARLPRHFEAACPATSISKEG